MAADFLTSFEYGLTTLFHPQSLNFFLKKSLSSDWYLFLVTCQKSVSNFLLISLYFDLVSGVRFVSALSHKSLNYNSTWGCILVTNLKRNKNNKICRKLILLLKGLEKTKTFQCSSMIRLCKIWFCTILEKLVTYI